MYPIHFFDRAARKWPDHVAVEWADESVSYAALHDRVRAMAAGLQTMDPEAGSRVGLCAYNSIDHLVCWLAVLAAGKVWVPLQPMNTPGELRRAIDHTRASIVIAMPETVDRVAGTGATILVSDPGSRAPGTTGAMQAAHAGQHPKPTTRPLDATQAIKFTGGSTGLPKGVMQPYRAWNTNIVTQIDCWAMAEGERCLAAAPITHGMSTYILPTLATGGMLVLLDRPRPQETLAALQTGRITTTFVPPTVLYMLMELETVGDSDYPALRNMIYGAGPMRPEAIARAQEIFGPCIASTYGQAEARKIVRDHRARKAHLPGFGHHLHHPDDPRALYLMEIGAREVEGRTVHLDALRLLSETIDAEFGRHITINATGATAALLGDMGIPVALMRGFAVISRAAGLVAHIAEEQRKPSGRTIWSVVDQAIPFEDEPTP